MAYDPITGEYEEEDTSVSKRVTGLLSKDTPYMQQAKTAGLQAANRRGLLNSSLAVSASEDARIRAALPIASQEAGQAHESNLTGRSLQLQDIGQRRDIASREGMQTADLAAAKERLGMQLTSEEKVALQNIQSRESMQATDISSRESMQLADIAAAKERLGMQLTQQERLALADIQSRESMQAADIAAQNERLATELGSRAALQEAELAAAKERLGMQLTQQEEIALAELAAARERLGLEIESREELAGLSRDLQERLARMDIASSDLRAAAQLAQGFEAAYSNMIAGIMANPEIPANERQRYLDHAARIRDSNLNLLEQFFSVDLQWSSGETPYVPPSIAGYSGGSITQLDTQ